MGDFLKQAVVSEFKEHLVLKLADNEKLEPEELERLSVICVLQNDL